MNFDPAKTMIEIPRHAISVTGGKMKSRAQAYFLSFVDDDPRRIVPRIALYKKGFPREGFYMEVRPIPRKDLRCGLDPHVVFESLTGEGPLSMPRREKVWDLALRALTKRLEIDLGKYPDVSLRLILSSGMTYPGTYTDCTKITDFVTGLFHIG
ncbi:MAG TPA: hypothetical protein VFT82_00315 [Candidatus Paceibacterota bacterium]|nr:hypothetical protein [Candidatus Paceibacterota bacterium]